MAFSLNPVGKSNALPSLPQTKPKSSFLLDVDRLGKIAEEGWMDSHPLLQNRVLQLGAIFISASDPLCFETAEKVKNLIDNLLSLGTLHKFAGDEAVKATLQVENEEDQNNLLKAFNLFNAKDSNSNSFQRLIAMQKDNKLASFLEHAPSLNGWNRFILLHISWETLKSHPKADQFKPGFDVFLFNEVGMFFNTSFEDEYNKYCQHAEYALNAYIDYFLSPDDQSKKEFKELLRLKITLL